MGVHGILSSEPRQMNLHVAAPTQSRGYSLHHANTLMLSAWVIVPRNETLLIQIRNEMHFIELIKLIICGTH